jgi:F-type H+-transporting ATPase subunit delta
VTTPTELTDKQKESIVEKLLQTAGYLSLEMNYQIDKKLLGGMRIRIGDRIMDNSIQTKLEEMTRKLVKVRV